ncbi:MAG: hypothetical protein QUV35_02045 [Hydrogenophaga sp.]|uniref:hypothetical protein n=1 Tax=Hydrogenophaga sp. TaxID=1904254 RepID=UPI0026053E32|nr:hypothetical protein [Hydrogenophaga sp.]MDM7941387.1 hypothetical protein [Hydrogenophaga sp.]
MRRSPAFFRTVPWLLLVALLAACGGGGGDGDSDGSPVAAYTIGGQLRGLATGQTVSVSNNGIDTLTLGVNGAFNFPTSVLANAAYAVTVRSHPAGQRCSVSQGSGNASGNVATVEVSCEALASNTVTIGGSVNGLGTGKVVELQNNGGDDLTVGSNGGFTFPTSVSVNAAYAVSVLTQPAGQTCVLTQASGTASASVSSVVLTCRNLVAGVVRPVYLSDTYREDRAGLLAQANAQGASGYAYLTGFAASGNDFINLYVRDLPTTYSWEALDPPGNAAGLLAQLNAQGARGFAHSTFLVDSVVYVRDAGGFAPFSHELLPSQSSSAGFLNQANAQGDRGFFFLGEFTIGGSTVAIYSRDSSGARYTYELQTTTTAATPDTFLAQANAQGRQGYRFIGEYAFSGNPGNDAFRNVYVRDIAQSATFEYLALPATTSTSALVAQANTEGELGSIFHGPVMFFPGGFSQPGVARHLYVRPVQCSGTWICRPASPL